MSEAKISAVAILCVRNEALHVRPCITNAVDETAIPGGCLKPFVGIGDG